MCNFKIRYNEQKLLASSLFGVKEQNMILSSAMKTISITQLVSSCMDAGRQGCEIIRSFHDVHQTAMDGRLKEGENTRSVVTQADVDAQAQILYGLRSTWGDDLLIIGEEDEDGDPIESYLRKDILYHDEEVQTVIRPDCDEEIPIEERMYCIYLLILI